MVCRPWEAIDWDLLQRGWLRKKDRQERKVSDRQMMGVQSLMMWGSNSMGWKEIENAKMHQEGKNPQNYTRLTN